MGLANNRLAALYRQLDTDRRNPEVHLRLAQALDCVGRGQGALEEYQLAAQLFLDRGFARKALAIVRILGARVGQTVTVRALGAAAQQSLERAPIGGAIELEERRRTPRIPWPKHITIWATQLGLSRFTGKRVFAIQARDVSTSGLAGVTGLSGPKVPVGHSMELLLNNPSLSRPGRIRARVTRAATEQDPSLGLALDWVDGSTMQYLVASVARKHKLQPAEVRNLHREVLVTPAFDFADWKI